MNRIKGRWTALLVVAAVSCFLGCQALSTKSGPSQAPGQLTPAPTSISFGNVETGTSQTKAGAITNTGQSSIAVTGIVVSGAGYSISGVTAPFTLAAGKSASFSILFAPKNAGSSDGNIAASTENATANITLSGTGVTPANLITSPSSFSFGTQLVGNASTQTETLKNTGGEDLTVTAATVSGTGFSYTGLTLPLTLAPNQASTFGVGFTPTTAGASSGNLSLTASGSTMPVVIALSGAGVTPATLTANPTSLAFTSVQVGQSSTQTETVTNMGGSNAQISEIGVSGTGLSVSGITMPVTLTPGQSTSFSVTFAPQSVGNVSGNVSVTSDASNPNLDVPLTGSAVGTPPSTLTVSNPISVGDVVDGQSGTQTGTLTATGASGL